MILRELFERTPDAYQDVSQDNSQPQKYDLRKTRLTLAQLNKLRRMNDLRQYEFEQKIKKIRAMYGAPAQPAM